MCAEPLSPLRFATASRPGSELDDPVSEEHSIDVPGWTLMQLMDKWI